MSLVSGDVTNRISSSFENDNLVSDVLSALPCTFSSSRRGLEERSGLGMALDTDSRSSGSLSSESWRMEEWVESGVWAVSEEWWSGLVERRERPLTVVSVDVNRTT